jgi:leucyl/phenylalanyl-tRNA--protein transferase
LGIAWRGFQPLVTWHADTLEIAMEERPTEFSEVRATQGRKGHSDPELLRARLVSALLERYHEGWFPMHDEASGEVEWVQPRVRSIIPIEPERFRVPRSLRAKVRRGVFEITTDAAFGRVIRACARPSKGREQTWLNPEITAWFELLHEAGHAHSIEAWATPAGAGEHGRGEPVLVGGLYGLAMGSVFAGESMFSRPDLGGTDASKVCLVHLVHHLRRRGFVLLDAQLENPHLSQFGATTMPRGRYIAKLETHASDARPWLAFEPEATRVEA